MVRNRVQNYEIKWKNRLLLSKKVFFVCMELILKIRILYFFVFKN